MRALKNLSISTIIKILPISVSRILATQLATMMNDADAKEDNTFSDFTLGGAKEIKSG